MAKRGNNIYRRADGRWEGRYYIKGTKKYKSVYGKSYTETKAKLDKLRSEVVVEPRCFSNRYKALLRKADVPSLKYHSLRHTFAVNAIHQDFDIKTLSELLGHSNANITMFVYLHSSMDRKSACMNRLQALI